MENSANLDLPFILPAQAQKHVTHNEALRMLDALVQLAVVDRDMAAPPAEPQEGARYIVAGPGAGAWAGQGDAITAFQDGAWSFLPPRPGWLAFALDENALLRFADGAWAPVAGVGVLQEIDRLGIGTTADGDNPFAAKLNTALWTARTEPEGGNGDLRFVMNKAAAEGTASLLFQTAHSGRAEIGLTGSDDLEVKVSADGAAWTSACAVNRASGAVRIGQALRVDGTIGIGRDGVAAGGIYFNRAGDNPFLAFSAGSAEAPTAIGQFRAQLAGNMIGIANATGGIYGVCYRAPDRVGVMTTTPAHTLGVAGGVGPQTDNAHALGTAALRWSTVYAATGTINASDARDKIVERPIAASAARIVDAVEPVLFRWKVGGVKIVETGTESVPDGEDAEGNPLFVERPVSEERGRPGERLHAGWLAQEVGAALKAEGIDCGAWGLVSPDEEASGQWLRPDQLTAFLWEALRETRRELAALSRRMPPAP